MEILFKTLALTIIVTGLTTLLGIITDWKERDVKICFIIALICTMFILINIIMLL